MMKRHNESGYILIGTILAIVLLAVVGLSLTSLATFSIQTSSKERDHQSVYYIAEAGLNYLANEFESATNEIFQDESVKTEADFYNKLMNFETLEKFSFLDTPFDTFEKVNGIQPYAELSIEKLPDDHKYRLISTGHLGDESRTVSQVIEVEWQDKFTEKENEEGSYELPPVAVLTSGKINIHGGRVKGSIATHLTEPESVEFNWGSIEDAGNIYVAEGASAHILKKPGYRTDIPSPIERGTIWQIPELPTFPTFPNLQKSEEMDIKLSGGQGNNRTIKLDKSKSFNTIEIKSGIHLTFDVGDTDKEIVIENFIVEQGFIHLIGKGKLNIYVTNELRFGEKNGGGSSRVNEGGNPNQLNIFYKGSENPSKPKVLKVEGHQYVYGSLFAEDANIELLNGGRVYGNIFTNGDKITISGSGKNISQLILAPNADVVMEGSASIHGRVISNTYSHHEKGNATITFGEPIIIEGPISIGALRNTNPDGFDGNSNSERIETGNKPNIYKSNIREVN